MIKNALRSISMFALVLLAGAGVAVAGSQDFTLNNTTGVDIAELYIGPSSSEEWGEDILGVDILEDGASVDITFSPKETAATWDLMVVDGDGGNIHWTNLKLNEISAITLHFENGKATADLE